MTKKYKLLKNMAYYNGVFPKGTPLGFNGQEYFIETPSTRIYYEKSFVEGETEWFGEIVEKKSAVMVIHEELKRNGLAPEVASSASDRIIQALKDNGYGIVDISPYSANPNEWNEEPTPGEIEELVNHIKFLVRSNDIYPSAIAEYILQNFSRKVK